MAMTPLNRKTKPKNFTAADIDSYAEPTTEPNRWAAEPEKKPKTLLPQKPKS